MARLSSASYAAKTANMISKFTPEQKDAKLLKQYARNRQLEASVEQLETECRKLTAQLHQAKADIQQLKYRLDYGHLQPYRIKILEVPGYPHILKPEEFDNFEKLDPADAVEQTVLSYHHAFDRINYTLYYLDESFCDRERYRVVGIAMM